MKNNNHKKKIKDFLEAIDPKGLIDHGKVELLLEDLIHPRSQNRDFEKALAERYSLHWLPVPLYLSSYSFPTKTFLHGIGIGSYL